MISVSNAFKSKIDSDFRYIVAKVVLNTTPATVLTKEDIIDFSILEEVEGISENPIGSISSNDLDLLISTFAVDTSVIKKGLKVTVYASLEITPDVFEDCSLGIYYVTDFSKDAEMGTMNIRCNDRIYMEKDKPVPLVEPVVGTTLQNAVNHFLTTCGVAAGDISIDANINQNLKYLWYLDDTFMKNLKRLAAAGCLNIYVTRANKYKVAYSSSYGASVATLTDENQIVSGKFANAEFKSYTGVSVKYNRPRVEYVKDLIKLDDTVLDVGNNVFTKLYMKEAPIANIVSIDADGSVPPTVTSMTCNTYEATFTVNSSALVSIVSNIAVHGYAIRNQFTVTEKLDATALVPKVCNVESELLQDAGIAGLIRDRIYNKIVAENAYVDLEIIGNPALEVGDVITVTYPRLGITNETMKILGKSTRFDGTISETLNCVRTRFL